MRIIINLMFALAAVAFLSATLNAQPVVKPKSFYEGRTYTWTNANGGTVTSNLADPATDHGAAQRGVHQQRNPRHLAMRLHQRWSKRRYY